MGLSISPKPSLGQRLGRNLTAAPPCKHMKPHTEIGSGLAIFLEEGRWLCPQSPAS